MLGANPGDAGLEWHGQLDDVGLFASALNDYQVSAIHKLGHDPTFNYSLGDVIALMEAHEKKESVVIGAQR